MCAKAVDSEIEWVLKGDDDDDEEKRKYPAQSNKSLLKEREWMFLIRGMCVCRD